MFSLRIQALLKENFAANAHIRETVVGAEVTEGFLCRNLRRGFTQLGVYLFQRIWQTT